jgi:hypothetical protein
MTDDTDHELVHSVLGVTIVVLDKFASGQLSQGILLALTPLATAVTVVGTPIDPDALYAWFQEAVKNVQKEIR